MTPRTRTVCVPALAVLRSRARVRLTHDRMTGENRPAGTAFSCHTAQSALGRGYSGSACEWRCRTEGPMDLRPRTALQNAACAYIASLVPVDQRIPAQGRWARRGRYVTSNRPYTRRPAVG